MPKHPNDRDRETLAKLDAKLTAQKAAVSATSKERYAVRNRLRMRLERNGETI